MIRGWNLLQYLQESLSPLLPFFFLQTPEFQRHEVLAWHFRHDAVGDVAVWERVLRTLKLAFVSDEVGDAFGTILSEFLEGFQLR